MLQGFQKNFIIVLNDNRYVDFRKCRWNVGDYLAKLVLRILYRFEKGVTNMLHNVPVVGDPMIEHIRKTKSSLKQLDRTRNVF